MNYTLNREHISNMNEIERSHEMSRGIQDSPCGRCFSGCFTVLVTLICMTFGAP